MGLNVLSCFDGISCGQLALQRAGIEVSNYFASEIDKYAIQITQKNFPNTVQLGDIENWREWNLPNIDLILAGSPCQGFSNAGLGLNFEDPRSKLFFVFVDVLKALRETNPNIKFLLENVGMKKEWRDVISDHLGVQPVMINSALVSAQNRKRLYWANWKFGQPEDLGVLLEDIVEDGNVEREKSYTIDSNYYKGGSQVNYVHKKLNGFPTRESERRLMVRTQGAAIRNQVTNRGVEEQLNIRKDGKSNCVVPSYTRRLNGLARIGTAEDIKGHDYNRRVYSVQGKSPTLAGKSGGNLEPKIATDDFHYRKLTPLECERLQTIPEGYTEGVSNTQRYKCIGNGWTVDVIAHILHGVK